jgi:hypothetical protein
MSFARRAFHVFWLVLVHLAVFDVVGVVACFVLDVAPLRYGSFGLLCAVWLVLGVFCGLIAFSNTVQYLSKTPNELPDSVDGKTGALVVWGTVLLLLGLSLLFHRLWWRFNWLGGDYFVPDGAVPTLTFFASVLAGMFLTRHVLHRPEPAVGSEEAK